jgi:hypothetical protein
MRVLEARFHPWRKAQGPFLVVGHVVCDRRRAVIAPSTSGGEELSAPPEETMLQKLAYLVGKSGPDAFRRLQHLRSEFWSFVEVERAGQP